MGKGRGFFCVEGDMGGKRIIGVTLFLLLSPSAWAQEPTKASIVRQAKAATTLVEVGGGLKHGSAFCIHQSGLFLTNDHVVRGVKEVKLILHPGLKNQQILKARVVRSDSEEDLALLHVEDKLDKTEFV